MLISLLKMTKNGSVPVADLKRDARLTSDLLRDWLGSLRTTGIVHYSGYIVETDPTMRMQIAMRALSLGADVVRVTQFLRWQEFEEIAEVALEYNGFVVRRNFRFKRAMKRMEIDVVGCRDPLVVCVDCKHWRRALSPSALSRVVNAQVERTSALADSLPLITSRLACQKWRTGRFIPVVLSLFPGRSKFHEGVPVVPILQFQDFVSQLPVNIFTIRHTKKMFGHLS